MALKEGLFILVLELDAEVQHMPGRPEYVYTAVLLFEVGLDIGFLDWCTDYRLNVEYDMSAAVIIAFFG